MKTIRGPRTQTFQDVRLHTQGHIHTKTLINACTHTFTQTNKKQVAQAETVGWLPLHPVKAWDWTRPVHVIQMVKMWP